MNKRGRGGGAAGQLNLCAEGMHQLVKCGVVVMVVLIVVVVVVVVHVMGGGGARRILGLP